MLEVQNLSVNYRGLRAIDNISLRLQRGELAGLIGPNGAGKSTLIKAMLGLVPTQRGQVLLDACPLCRQRHRVAYVPQRSQIDWDYPTSVWNVVTMALTNAQQWWRPSRGAKRLAAEALERVDMLALRHRPIGALSGGQQQRVFLARALAQRADVYFFDEPFTGIDKKTEGLVLALFSELKQAGKTLLVCSHEWGDSLMRYDRLLLLNRQLLANDCPKAVLTLENIHRAYGQNLQRQEAYQDLPFVC
ncbi:MAG: ABC transporter ATP-binding protein [Leptolyngbya sp. SIO4C1]|nr:ABC transporter ATP-binding protein [Leptolyngbya sp. SIO4C1]